MWMAYKVRLRSPFSTALDVLGPLVVILALLGFKLVLGPLNAPRIELPLNSTTSFFRNIPKDRFTNLERDFNRLNCNKILYHSGGNSGQNSSNDSLATDSRFESALHQECGIELVRASSRDEIIDKLQKSLDARMNHRQPGVDLNKSNKTLGCIQLQQTSQEPVYQLGIVRLGSNKLELYSTDSAATTVIHQPYSQGSTYNEYRVPQSDINLGIHLSEICLAHTSAGNVHTSNADKESGKSNATIDAINRQRLDNVPKLKWHVKPYPVLTGGYLTPTIVMLLLLLAHFCNAVATVLRVTEANELGIHHYIRLAGVPVCYYWLSVLIVTFIHMSIQSLIIAILLAIPLGQDRLFDPISDMNITIRWMLLLTYSLSLNVHGMSLGSLFYRTPHALLVTCFLASGYSMYAITFMLQWSPYGFSQFNPVTSLFLLNPVTNFEALLLVLFGVVLQENKPFNWSLLAERLVGGGFSSWSVGELWALLIIQTIFWLLGGIIIDQVYYSTANGIFDWPLAFINEFLCCLCLGPQGDRLVEDIKTKTSSPLKSVPSRAPNRICCSLRHFRVVGPTISVAHTRGNPLRMTAEQLERLKQGDDKTVSKATKFVVERTRSPSRSSPTRSPSPSPSISAPKLVSSSPQEDRIILDETIHQHIVWFDTGTYFEDLNLDFRFNQISYVLGQSNMKDLLFGSLLGTRSLKSGHMILDGAKYSSTTINLARAHIGYLAQRDIYLNEMTLLENLQLLGSLRDPSFKDYDSESLYVLSLLHLSGRKDNFPNALTSRSARKLALGIAAVGHTKLLLLVEPTSSLHWRSRCQVLNLLKKYKSIRSIVIDTSDVDEATAFGDRLVLLKNGRADLDDTPARLARRLSCGYWIVLMPTTTSLKKTARTAATTGSSSHGVNSEAIRSLEKLAGNLFKQDKLAIEITRQPMDQDMVNSNGSTTISAAVGVAGTDVDRNKAGKIARESEEKRRMKAGASSYQQDQIVVTVKVHPSSQSVKGLCIMLRMLNQQRDVHGFRLGQLTFESIEDVVVLRMSRATFPDLPPDLLLSLQHRTRSRPRADGPGAVSVRRYVSATNQQSSFQLEVPIFAAKPLAIVRDRISNRFEILIMLIALISALMIVFLTLFALKYSLMPTKQAPPSGEPAGAIALGEVLEHSAIERLYRYRIGLQIVGAEGSSSNSSQDSAERYLQHWTGSRALAGEAHLKAAQMDADYLADYIQTSKDLAASVIFFNPKTGEISVLFEPYLPHALFAGVRAFLNFKANLDSQSGGNYTTNSKIGTARLDSAGGNQSMIATSTTSRHLFQHPWHEMIRGYFNRRFIYGLGIALAEAISVGVIIMAPIRHRTEYRAVKVRTTYWLGMAIFDLSISLLLVLGYICLFIMIEDVRTIILPLFIVLLLYKLATLPIPYLVSLAAESSLNGFLFILLLYVTLSWNLSIHMRTFVEWTLIDDSYSYTIASWILLGTPIGSLIDALTVINQVDRMNTLCPQVPAYIGTKNIVDLDGIHRYSVIEDLLEKVQECLANGKSGVSTDVLHQQSLGVLWSIYLISLFGLLGWTFLLTSERFFGILARRFNSARTSNDPMKTVVRSPDKTTTTLFHWDRECDRLISEYIRCMNEQNYVEQMSRNCLILRIWFKPMSDQTSIDKRLLSILEPLYSLGQTKGDVQVELRTSLQMFIRIGDESKRCKVDKVQLIELYSTYVTSHSDSIAKFAVVDWTRENLYKILLHGHYNTRSPDGFA